MLTHRHTRADARSAMGRLLLTGLLATALAWTSVHLLRGARSVHDRPEPTWTGADVAWAGSTTQSPTFDARSTGAGLP
jgi:hypothetical protein